MAVPIKYVGEDINVTIKKRVSVGVYRDIDAMINVFVYFNIGTRVIKFAKTVGTLVGYQALVRVDAYTYIAQLTSANTTSLGEGDVCMTQDFITTDAGVPDGRSNKKSGKIVFTLERLHISVEA